MTELEELKSRLLALQQEHRDLDDAILALTQSAPYDQLKLQRLKKRKLALRDIIAKLESQLHPDIIA
ncbi:MAG: DUF465 domain-containing protein [Alphaproteobacteria bacterium]|nr:DUF465 domain-containing protein [Alphaproteobacteria bacterium]